MRMVNSGRDIITAHCTWEGDPEDSDFDKNAWVGRRAAPQSLQELAAHCQGQEVRPAKPRPMREMVPPACQGVPAAAAGSQLQDEGAEIYLFWSAACL